MKPHYPAYARLCKGLNIMLFLMALLLARLARIVNKNWNLCLTRPVPAIRCPKCWPWPSPGRKAAAIRGSSIFLGGMYDPGRKKKPSSTLSGPCAPDARLTWGSCRSMPTGSNGMAGRWNRCWNLPTISRSVSGYLRRRFGGTVLTGKPWPITTHRFTRIRSGDVPMPALL